MEPGAHSATEAPNGESQESAQHRATEPKPGGSNPETVFGINPDSTPAVVAAAAFSLLFALAVWLWGRRLLLRAVVILGTVFAVLDLREVVRQIERARTPLIVIAALIAAMHLAVSLLATLELRRGSSN